jgi:hypothetical protein
MPKTSNGYHERTAYKNMGCRYHSDCFTCPFPDCRYVHSHETIYNGLTRKHAERDDGIREARLAGESCANLADHYGLSVQTIQNITVGCGKVGRPRKS